MLIALFAFPCPCPCLAPSLTPLPFPTPRACPSPAFALLALPFLSALASWTPLWFPAATATYTHMPYLAFPFAPPSRLVGLIVVLRTLILPVRWCPTPAPSCNPACPCPYGPCPVTYRLYPLPNALPRANACRLPHTFSGITPLPVGLVDFAFFPLLPAFRR